MMPKKRGEHPDEPDERDFGEIHKSNRSTGG
jgi:hypothetical protein